MFLSEVGTPKATCDGAAITEVTAGVLMKVISTPEAFGTHKASTFFISKTLVFLLDT